MIWVVRFTFWFSDSSKFHARIWSPAWSGLPHPSNTMRGHTRMSVGTSTTMYKLHTRPWEQPPISQISAWGSTDWQHRPSVGGQARQEALKTWTLAQNHCGRGFWGLPYIEHSLERLGTNSGWHISLTALEWGTHPEEDQCGTLWSGGKGPLKLECCPLAPPAWV